MFLFCSRDSEDVEDAKKKKKKTFQEGQGSIHRKGDVRIALKELDRECIVVRRLSIS